MYINYDDLEDIPKTFSIFTKLNVINERLRGITADVGHKVAPPLAIGAWGGFYGLSRSALRGEIEVGFKY